MEIARPGEVDFTRPHPVRVYDYWLGGKDNYAVDREVADRLAAAFPRMPQAARANRRFLQRAVPRLVRELGIRQFLDIGSGMPTRRNTHEVAQEIDPTARVVYVDNDPVVAAHSRALLAGDPRGATAFVHGDAADPAAVLADPGLRAVLDPDEPVGLMMLAVLPFLPEDVAVRSVRAFLDALPPGSIVTISHPTTDFAPEYGEFAERAARTPGLTYTPRSREQVEAMFAGAELLEPGLVPMLAWRPEQAGPRGSELSIHFLVGMGRRPANPTTAAP
ncbi:SAM-dependent methyltransferase [Pseudonocardia lacus]|uniref:SAM-dependent methyltransferase n=1 Tax=Pseudonocardia lacus TaxID=2835865 RepID=UPI0027E22AD0|nr:SAM-dependent methyltransferase [Pseudonocardia lacus]